MLPENRIPTHPGEVLLLEFLNPFELSQVAFAEHIDVPVQRINEIVRGKRGISSETPKVHANFSCQDRTTEFAQKAKSSLWQNFKHGKTLYLPSDSPKK